MKLSIKKFLIPGIIAVCVSSKTVFALEISDAKIKTFHGEVEVSKKVNDPVQPAVEGMNLIPSSVVSTGFNSFCITAVDQDNSFRIKQNTVVQISKLWEESQKKNSQVVKEVQLNLLKGDILVRLDNMPQNSEFNVQGPSAIAGASGTCFIVGADPVNQQTFVTVLDHAVNIESLNDGDKVIKLKKFQHVVCAPWAKISINVKGRGALSGSVSGEKNSDLNGIVLQTIGKGGTAEAAREKSLSELALIITQLPVDKDINVESILLQDPILTEKLYDAIAKARTADIANDADGSFRVQAELDLSSITEALGRPLPGITQSMTEIKLEEYVSKFGDAALKVTQEAAQAEAYRNLAKIIYRAIVKTEVTIGDTADQNEKVRAAVEAAVKEAGTQYVQYFSDGSVIVNLNLQGGLIPERLAAITGNIYGQNYLSGAQLMDFGDYLEYPDCEPTVKAYSEPNDQMFIPTGPEVTEEEPASSI